MPILKDLKALSARKVVYFLANRLTAPLMPPKLVGMKIASLREGRDGKLVVVSSLISNAWHPPKVLRRQCKPPSTTGRKSRPSYRNAGKPSKATVWQAARSTPQNAPQALPRCYHWADGSVYLNHMELVRKSRGATMPESFLTDALMYQGGSDILLGACDDIPVIDEDWGIDLEAEVAVITDDVPMGVSADEAPEPYRTRPAGE